MTVRSESARWVSDITVFEKHKMGFCQTARNWGGRSSQIARACAAAVLVMFSSIAPASGTPALVVDLGTEEVLYSEDSGAAWYPASTTKLMTALVVFESLEAGSVALDTTVVMSENAMRQRFLNSGLSVGKAMSLDDALFATIAGSANDVAVALAETVAGSEESFIELMNAAAARLQMTMSHFTNPNGLFNRDQRTSARDLAILTSRLVRDFPQYLRYFQVSQVVIDGHLVESNNDLLTRFPGAFGMKTGFLCSAGRNIVATAQRDGRIILVVLLGATTERERSERSALLLHQAFSRELQPTGNYLTGLTNEVASAPHDMRLKLCSGETAAYERAQEELYPMGLPGHASYLSPVGATEEYHIHTWRRPISEIAPVPPIRPSTQ